MTENNICVCGRDNSKVHCSECGRFACYAKSSKSRIVETPFGPIRIMMYHCRGCGNDFDDLNRARCNAPKRPLSVAAQRVGDQVVQSLADLPPEERQAKLKELFGRK